jgi:hypothetical protein
MRNPFLLVPLCVGLLFSLTATQYAETSTQATGVGVIARALIRQDESAQGTGRNRVASARTQRHDVRATQATAYPNQQATRRSWRISATNDTLEIGGVPVLCIPLAITPFEAGAASQWEGANE